MGSKIQKYINFRNILASLISTSFYSVLMIVCFMISNYYASVSVIPTISQVITMSMYASVLFLINVFEDV